MLKTLLFFAFTVSRALHVEHGITPDIAEPHSIVHVPDPFRIIGPSAPWQPPDMMSEKLFMGSHNEAAYPRRASVNLDLPPSERWVDVISQYKLEIIPYFITWQNILNQHTEIDQEIWSAELEKQLPEEYQTELKSIVATVNNDAVTWSNILLFAAMYEMGSPMGCSEIIAAGPDGTMVHGRNLDYRAVAPLIEVSFLKDGRVAYASPVFLGSVSTHTIIKPGAWSLGQNSRITREDNPDRALQRLRAGGKIYSLLTRGLADQELPYEAVLSALQNAPLMRSMYFIIAGAGPYEGAVVARAADPSFKHTDEISKNGKWFLVQTNDDLGTRPKDARRNNGIQSMISLTQAKMNPTTVLKIMYSPPLYSPGNIVLFMMAPMSGQFCSVLGPQIFNDDTSVHCSMNGWLQQYGPTKSEVGNTYDISNPYWD